MTSPDRILIVDDEPATQEMLCHCLASLGYDIVPASNGHQALELLKDMQFNVVILDLMLPGLNGIEILRRIHEQQVETEVVVLTAYASLKTAIEAVRLGAYDYVTKPFHTEILRSTVKGAMEKQRLAARLAAIHALSREMTLSLAMGQVAEAVLDIAERVLKFETCNLWLVDEEQSELYLLAAHTVEPGAAPRLPLSGEKGITTAVARSSEPIYVPDVREDHRYAAVGAANRSELAVPLKVKTRVIGTLNVESAEVDAFNPDDVRLLSTLAAQAAVAIENARLHEQAQQEIAERKQAEEEVKRRARELAALNKTGQAITSTLNLDEVLALAMAEARAILDAEGASVLLHDAAGDELVFVASAGPGSEVLVGTRILATAGIAGWVMHEARPVLIRDAQHDPRFYDRIDDLTSLTTRSLLAVPLKYKGKVIGVLEAINRDNGHFDEHDLELLSTLAGSAATAIENARLYEAERELRKLVEQSQAQLVQSEKLAATGRLAASLAHEINNPLQAIHNSLQLILTFPLEADEQTDYLRMASEEVERLVDMVTRVLNFARQPQREMKPTNPNVVVEKVLVLTNKYLQHRHIALQRDILPNSPTVLATQGELEQVFLNLTLNAVEAMPQGGTLRVSSRLAKDGRLAVAFSDTGHGISPKHLDRIFEPFFSTKEEGTGLGLSISYNVVKRHGGEITVQSIVGKGTTFTVWLPTLPG